MRAPTRNARRRHVGHQTDNAAAHDAAAALAVVDRLFRRTAATLTHRADAGFSGRALGMQDGMFQQAGRLMTVARARILRRQPVEIGQADLRDQRLIVRISGQYRAGEAFQREQAHLGVVRDDQFALVEIGLAQAGQTMRFLDVGQTVELDDIAEAIADGAAEQAGQPARHRLVVRRRDFARFQDMAFLRAGLDGARSSLADAADGFAGRHAEFHHQTRGDHAGAAESDPAVNHHLAAAPQQTPQAYAGIYPAPLELPARHVHVRDRQVIPVESGRFRHVAQARHVEQIELVVIEQGDQRARSPGTHTAEVDREIARTHVGAGHRILLAGAEGHPERAETVLVILAAAQADAGDGQGLKP
jgi:hypothetical protein